MLFTDRASIRDVILFPLLRPESLPARTRTEPWARGLPFELLIGLRYLRSKGGRGFLSLLTVIAMAGMAIGVMALIVVLAVMSGFEDELRSKILGTTSHILVMDVSGRGIQDPARPWRSSAPTRRCGPPRPSSSSR